MKYFSAEKWDENKNGQLSMESLKKLYQPPEHYRISYNSYPVDTEVLGGVSQEDVCYVVRGQVTFSRPNQSDSVVIGANEYALLPKGTYDLHVGKDVPVELLRVWDLSKLSNRPRESQSF